MPQIKFSQYVEYVTEGPVVHPVALEQHDLGNPLTLAVVSEGYQHVEQLGRKPTLDSAALGALKAAAAGHYAADVVDNEIVSDDPAQVVDRLLWVKDRPHWWAGAQVERGGVWWDEGTLWRCNISHTTQSDWRPSATPSLWSRYYALDKVHEWVQPAGAQDAWALGARVTHAGHTWRSLIANNVREPGAVGSESLWGCEDCEPPTAEWAAGVVYKGDNTAGAGNGDVVTYQGAEYRCLQSHTSQTGWTPVAVPALWLAL